MHGRILGFIFTPDATCESCIYVHKTNEVELSITITVVLSVSVNINAHCISVLFAEPLYTINACYSVKVPLL